MEHWTTVFGAIAIGYMIIVTVIMTLMSLGTNDSDLHSPERGIEDAESE